MDARTRVLYPRGGIAPALGATEILRFSERDSVAVPRLLSINNFFYRRGGSEAVFFEHNRLLEEAGWDVVPFAMCDSRNLPTPWAVHFADPVELAAAQPLQRKFIAAGKLIYSFEARRRVRHLVQLTQPTIAHAHNIYHHLSPSILLELRHQGVPVVMTLHDLKLACPAYKMFSHGAVCERCRGGHLRHVVSNRCIKGSLGMSALVWLEMTLHRLLDLYAANIRRFVVPSRFFLAKLTEWGFDAAQFVHIPNFVDTETLPVADADGQGFVYFGRLVPEKGVATLISAAARARVRLLIVGTGPEESALRRLADECGGDVAFTGHLHGAALRDAVGSARAIVIPSEWYENAPVSLMEASAMGKVVIGARIGGIPELIRDGETGVLFDSGDVQSLEQALRKIEALPRAAVEEMGQSGRRWMRAEFSPSHYRDRTLSLYSSLGVG